MIRVPYNLKAAPALILPPTANTLPAAIAATKAFLDPSTGSTAVITGAGVSVESGIPDYRGPTGTYTVNKGYRPIFYSEFIDRHDVRKRYWARSFLGWEAVRQAKPNRVHRYIGELMKEGWISSLVTQNVDSLHSHYVPDVTEIHGSLASVVCMTCHTSIPRVDLQTQLAELNPAWADLLQQELDRLARAKSAVRDPIKDFRLNPDGDLELPDSIRYDDFKYPACPACVGSGVAHVDIGDGMSWSLENQDVSVPHSKRKCKDVGVLKPNVVFFGENVDPDMRAAAERKMSEADKILVVASSLATYSAFRLIKENKLAGKAVGVINMGPVRGEHDLLGEGDLRLSFLAGDVLGGVWDSLRKAQHRNQHQAHL
ncbi:DHS-like NAD/FAD-binding domain-containing protein [Myxozyma melibiosi]|uniref:DHS-like NAD/FAD-binding domain-containing protein n=1 Tax=Myxozyma melibiosi TaxID=54550 RepID=A0ABR1FB15_9ASCO